MAKVEALAPLKDIHMPPPISFWPPAPGWYVALIFSLFLLFFLGYFLYKKHSGGRAKRKALALLEVYGGEYETHQNAALTSAQISQLLKRVALSYYPRAEVAGLWGDAWINFLNNTSHSIDFNPVKALLLSTSFKEKEKTNLSPLIQCARQWIKARRGPCCN